MSAPDSQPAPQGQPPRSRGWVIGRIAGAPVILTPSWFLAAVVLTLLFAPTVNRIDPDLGPGIYLVSFGFVLLLFVSVFLHEVAHALVGRAKGQTVTELAVTVWGGHTAYAGGSRRPADAFLVAVVGPVTNLLLGGAMWFGYERMDRVGTVGLLLFAGAFSNLFVGVFNLLPGLPLDGGQMLESAVWAITRRREAGTVAAAWVGRVVAAGVLVWALGWPLLRGYGPDFFTVAWALLIAGFLWTGASQALRAGHTRQRIGGIAVRPLTQPAIAIPETASVAEAGTYVAQAGGPHIAAVLVDSAGRPLAVIDPAAASAVPTTEAALTPAAAVATYLPGVAIDIGLGGDALFGELARHGINSGTVAVAEGGRVAGVLDLRRVIAALRSGR